MVLQKLHMFLIILLHIMAFLKKQNRQIFERSLVVHTFVTIEFLSDRLNVNVRYDIRVDGILYADMTRNNR